MVARLTATLLRSASSALVRISRPSAILSDLARPRSCRCLARVSAELCSKIVCAQRAAKVACAAFASELLDMTGDQRVDAAAGFRQLVQVGFQRALENVAAFGELFDLAGDEPVDAGAAFARACQDRPAAPGSGRRGRPRTSRHGCSRRPLMPARSASSAWASVSRPDRAAAVCSATMPSTT